MKPIITVRFYEPKELEFLLGLLKRYNDENMKDISYKRSGIPLIVAGLRGRLIGSMYNIQKRKGVIL